MGIYLNPGSKAFEESLNSEIYVDKSGLIGIVNSRINTRQKYLCISRPRRFGKTMAMDMLSAYYDRSIDSEALFSGQKIAREESCRKHLNQYDVLKINMQEFLSQTRSVEEMLSRLQKFLAMDLLDSYRDVRFRDQDNLVQVMKDVYANTRHSFVILIDEWDCLFREYQDDRDSQKKYLDFLRSWLKDQEYVALAYMTGILPIKKYGTHSALNMFAEYSMTDPGALAEYFGFTEEEVRALCDGYSMSFEEARAWYDGYRLVSSGEGGGKVYSMYSPRSVVESMMRRCYGTYWNQTETYEALKVYISMNYDGLKDAVVRMLAGESVPINVGTFSNDMTTFSSKDDVLTLLVHLGYLSYDSRERSVSIPNREVSMEYVNAISTMDWPEVTRSVMDSKKLLEALWAQDADAVAAGVERAHEEISVLQYNDENSLSCTVTLAFYFAREYYTVVRELPAGKGFADICLIPRRKYADKPAAVIELKWDRGAEGAVSQIREKNYPAALQEYSGELLLAGISYDRKTKKHSCVIEKEEKQMK